jgi:outer membrane immunogenic protein
MRGTGSVGLLTLAGLFASDVSGKAATLDDVIARLESLQRDNQAIRRDNAAMRKEISALRQREQTQPTGNGILTPEYGQKPLPQSASTAMAADVPGPYYKATPIEGPYNWSGVYAGLNAGYAFGQDTTTVDGFGTATSDYQGFLGGGQVGFNWQYSGLVFGVEADVQFAAIGGSSSLLTTGGGGGPFASSLTNNKLDAFGTVRGRIGYAFDRVLVYGTGGFAAGRNTVSATQLVSLGGGDLITVYSTDSTVHTGWVAGGGLEYGFRAGWSAKAEYLHIGLDSKSTLLNDSVSAQFKFDLVRGGVNYRF